MKTFLITLRCAFIGVLSAGFAESWGLNYTQPAFWLLCLLIYFTALLLGIYIPKD